MKPGILPSLRPMIIVFIVLNAFLITGKNWLLKAGIDQEVMIIGNLILFAVMAFSFFITRRSFDTANPNAFVRAIYGGFIVKFFVIAIAAFVYIMISKKNVNKPALFSCMGLYVLYTFLEVSSLLRLLKPGKNG